MAGQYSIHTDARGENTLTVDASVKAKGQFHSKSIFGLGWKIEEENTSQAEAFTAMWSWSKRSKKY
jgi:hypothetical protein